MERALMKELVSWKNKAGRKPLIINGARQVGKTWLMEEFGRCHFNKTIYLNFDYDEQIRKVFESGNSIDEIIRAIKIKEGTFSPDETLLIFDEVQECPKALGMLKYFYEKVPEYYIVAAGSFMGIALHSGTSFPVGKVEIKTLFPFTFEEFLNALSETELCSLLETDSFSLISSFSEKYKNLLKMYYYVGGMPEAVKCYIESGNLEDVREIQNRLLLYYSMDFSKHVPKEQIPRVQMVWDSIPAQLAKENRKFLYGMVREGARAKEYELAIQWLSDYGLVHKCTRVSKPGLPLLSYAEQASFKLYFLDVGLLAARGKLSAKVLLDGSRIFEEFKGALTEQFVAEQLIASGHELYYYSTEKSSGEIDFITQIDDRCVPLEIKAAENLQAKSLRAFCEKYKPDIAIRSSMSDYRKETWMVNVPLYYLSNYLKRL